MTHQYSDEYKEQRENQIWYYRDELKKIISGQAEIMDLFSVCQRRRLYEYSVFVRIGSRCLGY